MTLPNHEITWLDLGHSTVPYQVVGTGPDVVFVHGWPLHGGTWRHLVEALSDDYTCHVFDLPGSGRSIFNDDSPISLQGHARTVREIVDRLGLDRYALVAHDSGAAFARYVAAEDPRVCGLVMGNTEIPGHKPPMLQLMVAAGGIPGFKAGLKAVMRTRAGRRSRAGFGSCFHNLELIDGAFHDLFVAPLLAHDEAFDGELRLLDTFDWSVFENLADIHAQIACPVHLVWGADDPWFPLKKARPMMAEFGGDTHLTVLENAKLFCHEEYPAAFAEATRFALTRMFPAKATLKRAS